MEITILKRCKEEVTVKVVTRPDTALEEKDFSAVDTEITLAAEETEKKFCVDIKHDPACTPDKDFYITLKDGSSG